MHKHSLHMFATFQYPEMAGMHLQPAADVSLTSVDDLMFALEVVQSLHYLYRQSGVGREGEGEAEEGGGRGGMGGDCEGGLYIGTRGIFLPRLT